MSDAVKLSEMNLLAGQTETITAMKFRKSPGEVLQQVALGKIYVITKYGKAIAEIHRSEPTAFELGAAIRKGISKG